MNRVFAITGNGAEKNPDQGPIDDFWNQAVNFMPTLSGDHQVRSIGIDEETTGLIINFIKAGEKVGTFSFVPCFLLHKWIFHSRNLLMLIEKVRVCKNPKLNKKRHS